MWAGHTWRKKGSFSKTIIEENSFGKKSLRTRMDWPTGKPENFPVDQYLI